MSAYPFSALEIERENFNLFPEPSNLIVWSRVCEFLIFRQLGEFSYFILFFIGKRIGFQMSLENRTKLKVAQYSFGANRY